MATISIAILNSSSVLTDDQVKAVVPALQTQVSRDFAPVWGVDANLRFAGSTEEVAQSDWWLVILDNSDQAGALGYHDLTTAGMPLGKVFAKSDIDNNLSWSITASHELLEMLGDPDINLCVLRDMDQGGRLYAYETCDACEGDDFGYQIDGVLVSDFVYPAWFEGFRQPGSTQFDFQNQINEPFQLLAGGYIGILDITSASGWTQLTAERFNHRSRAPVGSRRERRGIPHNKRIPSMYNLD